MHLFCIWRVHTLLSNFTACRNIFQTNSTVNSLILFAIQNDRNQQHVNIKCDFKVSQAYKGLITPYASHVKV